MQNKKFNFNAKRVFLTYPKCTLSKDAVLTKVQEIYPVEEYIIASEKHQDGSPHLHVVLFFHRKVHRDNDRAFDLEGFHPNIQGIKNAQDKERIIKYVKKDGDFLSNITEKVSARELLAKRVLEEGLTPKVLQDNPTLLFLNYTSVQAWSKWYQSRTDYNYTSPNNTKRIHYWLHGPSNCGKTYWLRALLDTWDGAEIPENNDYSTISNTTNLLFKDEFKGSITVQQLNRLADGYTTLNTKGGSVYLRRAVVVIVSNFSIRECYINSTNDILTTLYNRFYEYDCSINLPRLPKYIIN